MYTTRCNLRGKHQTFGATCYTLLLLMTLIWADVNGTDKPTDCHWVCDFRLCLSCDTVPAVSAGLLKQTDIFHYCTALFILFYYYLLGIDVINIIFADMACWKHRILMCTNKIKKLQFAVARFTFYDILHLRIVWASTEQSDKKIKGFWQSVEWIEYEEYINGKNKILQSKNYFVY